MPAAKRGLLLKKLLSTSHLNAVERKQLTLPVVFSELVTTAQDYFTTEKFLPGTVGEWDGDKLNYEGYCIEKRGNAFILHSQQAGPFLNLTGGQDRTYEELRQVLHAYLQGEFQFNIDGIPIVEA